MFCTPQREAKEGRKWGADSGGEWGEEFGKTSLEWGTLTQTHSVSRGALSGRGLWAPVFGEVGSGVQLPTSLALSSRTLAWGRRRTRPAGPLAATRPWPPLDPFKTAWAASLCLLKLFSFRTGQRRGAGGGHTCCGT